MQVFSANTLRELDMSAYEEAPPLSHEEAMAQMERHNSAASGASKNFTSARLYSSGVAGLCASIQRRQSHNTRSARQVARSLFELAVIGVAVDSPNEIHMELRPGGQQSF